MGHRSGAVRQGIQAEALPAERRRHDGVEETCGSCRLKRCLWQTPQLFGLGGLLGQQRRQRFAPAHEPCSEVALLTGRRARPFSDGHCP